MGIGITSNTPSWAVFRPSSVFQSPMGIGITSNCSSLEHLDLGFNVSIPNGDRHYLELLDLDGPMPRNKNVSIPNGDRHYLEQLSNNRLDSIPPSFNPQWG